MSICAKRTDLPCGVQEVVLRQDSMAVRSGEVDLLGTSACSKLATGLICQWTVPVGRLQGTYAGPSTELQLSSQAQTLLSRALHLTLPKAQHRPALCFWRGSFALSTLLASNKEEFHQLFSVGAQEKCRAAAYFFAPALVCARDSSNFLCVACSALLL